MELKETRLSGETVYKGKIVTLKVDEALLPNGATAGREVVEHPGGVCVLALQEDGTVPLVRQFRYPLGDVMLELPAGKLEYGEEPRPAAIRELGEEVGLEPGELTDLGHIYVSPGFCTEKLHMYLAREVKRVPVHPDEDEFLDIVHLPFGELGGGILHMLGRIHGVAIADSDVEELKGLLRDMPVHGDVAAGLRLLQEAGCSLVTLTNSPKSSGPDPLDKAGLSELFDRKFTVDTVRCFKPASATYALVQKEMEADPKTTWLVAAHVWDTIGAQSFGWKAAHGFTARSA